MTDTPAPQDMFAQAGIAVESKPVKKEALQVVAVRLPAAVIEVAKTIGNGKISDGIRKLFPVELEPGGDPEVVINRLREGLTPFGHSYRTPEQNPFGVLARQALAEDATGKTVPIEDLMPEPFDLATEEAKKNRAIARVGKHADPAFMGQALQSLFDLCVQKGYGGVVTSDDVWDLHTQRGGMTPREARAMGAVFTIARNEGWCKLAPDLPVRKSRRKDNHRHPVQPWRSLLGDAK